MKVLKPTCFMLAVLLCFFALQQLFMPKYMSGVYEGAMIREYYAEPKNHDVIFVGDCEVYENFSPITLWQEYGITSYIRGGPQQLIWQSYYLLEDTLRYEKPDVVVYNVLSMKTSAPASEAYNRLNIDGMELSSAKLGAIEASKTEEETLLSYLFPFFRYHERWAELTNDDIQYYLGAKKVAHNGFMMRADVKPVGVVPKGAKLPEYQFGDICYDYLDKMVQLCENAGVQLVLVKAPSLYPYWHEEWDEQIVSYAQAKNLMYINFLDHIEDVDLDFSKDTYDAGLHLNLTGAEKLSVYFGKILSEGFNLQDHRQDVATSAVWQEKVLAYQQMAAAQYSEIEETGKVSTFIF